MDKFNKLGHLINIDEYYLFQPIELNNDHISVFDRRNPIDYKHKEVVFPVQMKEDDSLKVKPAQIVKIIDDESDEKKRDSRIGVGVDESIKLVRDIETNYNTAVSDVNEMKRGEDDWYLFAAYLKTTGYLETNIGIDDDVYKSFIITHILENLDFQDTKKLLNYIYFINKDKLTEIDRLIKNYYDTRIMENKGVTGIICSKDNKPFLLVKGTSDWSNGQQEDYTDLTPELKNLIIKPITTFSKYVGFIGNFKNEYNIFKVKNMSDSRSKGSRCDQSGKSNATKLLNSIIDETKYTQSNTKSRNKLEFCVLQEMYLRFYDKINKDEKRWFLNPSEMIINNIEKISF